MSTLYLSTQSWEGVVFDDLAAMNADLRFECGLGAMLGHPNIPPGAPFVHVGPAGMQFMDRHDGIYRSTANIDRRWGRPCCEVVARHMRAGKLVLRVDVEGSRPQYWSLTPGHAQLAEPALRAA